METFESLADRIGKYVIEKYVKPREALTVRYFRATVTAPAADGKITVQRPFDTPMALPYVSSAAELAEGEQCVVLVLGSMSNCIVLGDGTLSNL